MGPCEYNGWLGLNILFCVRLGGLIKIIEREEQNSLRKFVFQRAFSSSDHWLIVREDKRVASQPWIAYVPEVNTDLLYNCCLILKIHSQILKILLTNLVMSPISKRVMMVLGRCHSNGSTPMTVQRNALVDCSRFACENIQIDGKTPCFGYTQSGWRSFPPALRQSGQSW
jgi:hypothetical protein